MKHTAMFKNECQLGYKRRSEEKVFNMRAVDVKASEIHKEHRNNVGHNKSIILWFPSEREPLPSEVIETYFDKVEKTHKPILH